MVPRPERYQMGVVSRGWDTDRASAAHVGMTELVGELLELIGIKVVVIPQHVVVAGSAGALKGEKKCQFRMETVCGPSCSVWFNQQILWQYVMALTKQKHCCQGGKYGQMLISSNSEAKSSKY